VIVFVKEQNAAPVCCRLKAMEAYLAKGDPKNEPEYLWQANHLNGHDTVSLALAPNAIVAVYSSYERRPRESEADWRVCCLSPRDGRKLWDHALPLLTSAGPLMERKQLRLRLPASVGGLLIDRAGRVIVVMENGKVVCYG
jgi:hypothetical protein